jgi:hypothetical protein
VATLPGRNDVRLSAQLSVRRSGFHCLGGRSGSLPFDPFGLRAARPARTVDLQHPQHQVKRSSNASHLAHLPYLLRGPWQEIRLFAPAVIILKRPRKPRQGVNVLTCPGHLSPARAARPARHLPGTSVTRPSGPTHSPGDRASLGRCWAALILIHCHPERSLCHPERPLCHPERPLCHPERSEGSASRHDGSASLRRAAYGTGILRSPEHRPFSSLGGAPPGHDHSSQDDRFVRASRSKSKAGQD